VRLPFSELDEHVSHYPFGIIVEHWRELANGLVVTIEISLLSLLLSIVLGTMFGVARLVPYSPISALFGAYVEFFRNIPPLVHLYFLYFGLPRIGIVFPSFWCGVFGLTLYHAAFTAEILRAGIEVVGRNQMEAGRALGLSYIATMRYIILPQAFWVVLPPLGNLFVSLFKTSALVATIGAADLMYVAEILHERTFQTVTVFTFVGIVYLALSLLMGAGVHRLEALTNARRASSAA
jgi:His/Glu/Gln/Arg/opine family amino acid ABC transporter permease subunit